MNKLSLYIFTLLLTITSSYIQANSWEHLYNHSQYQNAKISPDGNHLAVSLRYQERVILVFFDRKTMTPVGQAAFQSNYEPGLYYWVNNERVVIQLVKRVYSKEAPISYGELYAVNYDGTKGEMIFGLQAGEMQTGSRLKKKKTTLGWGEIIDILPQDDEHILISSTPMSETGERLASALKINVYTGIIKKDYGRSPIPFAQFLADNEGKPIVVSGINKDNDSEVYIKKNNSWVKLAKGIIGSRAKILSLDPSDNFLYTIDDYEQDRRGIFKLNLKDYTYSHIFTDRSVDITDIEMSSDGRNAYAIRVDEGYPAYLILDKNNEEAQTFKSLLSSFPYSELNITSKTENNDYYIVYVSSDIDPGSLYLFDKNKNQISLLFQYAPNIKSKDLREMEPVKYTASDGTLLHGYFTSSINTTKDKPSPLVVLIHGGPHGVRDYWGFSRNVQYLALNGYSVLQINYRGSGGYGRQFEVSGHRNWGSQIQQDILDGYQWLVKQNKAIEGNACIMGASFGAYSALQSAALYPEVYKCAIANAGVYDLELLFEKGDVQSRKSGMSYLRNVLGSETNELKSMSPVNYVEKIQIPLLLAHGKDDERAPFEHVERLQIALDKAEKPYEWHVIEKEGHGFYNPENQKAYMKKVVGFLGKHLK